MKVDYFTVPDAKALVVDDFPINLEVAKEMLAPYQMKVYCALSGRQAVRLIQEGKTKYDIVFMDHMMPEMDGMETVKTIRGLESNYAQRLPIVALTACADESQADNFLNNGFQGFLTKPLNPTRLNAVLRELLEAAPKTGAPSSSQEHGEAQAGDGHRPSALNEALTQLFGHARVGGIPLTDSSGRYNDADTYARVLDSFKRNVSKQVLDLLRSRTDLGACAILAHGIKGGCYGVGADEAAKTAETIETAAKAGDSDAVSRSLVPFANLMEQMLADIETLLEQVKRVREEHATAHMREPDKSALSELYDAATNYDAVRMRKAMERLDSFVYDSGGELVTWLRQKVSDFSYDSVREKLKDTLNK